MLGKLWKFLIGNFHVCDHKWIIHKEVKVAAPLNPYIISKQLPNVEYGTRYYLRCEKCGEMTVRGIKL